MTDADTAIRYIVGDSEEISRSIGIIEMIIPSIQSPLHLKREKSSVISTFQYLRILHFVGFNPGTNRYQISKTLGSPHSSTLNLVQQLCTYGLIKIDRIEMARTGLTKVSYSLTSLGLIPIMRMLVHPLFEDYLLAASDVGIEAELLSEMRRVSNDTNKRLPQLIEKCRNLPWLELFFKNWALFEEKNVEELMLSRLCLTLDSDKLFHIFTESGRIALQKNIDQDKLRSLQESIPRLFMEMFSVKNREKIPREVLVKAIRQLLDSFSTALMDGIITDYLVRVLDAPSSKRAERMIEKLFETFHLNQELKQLLLDYINGYEDVAERKLAVIKELERKLDSQSSKDSANFKSKAPLFDN